MDDEWLDDRVTVENELKSAFDKFDELYLDSFFGDEECCEELTQCLINKEKKNGRRKRTRGNS